jgi:hypothetical protein
LVEFIREAESTIVLAERPAMLVDAGARREPSFVTEATGFWAGGRRAHGEALAAAEKEALAALRERMSSASEDERARLEGQMDEVREAYREKRKLARHNWYIRSASDHSQSEG